MTNSIGRMSGMFAGFVGRPVALAVAFVTMIVVGIISYDRIPVQLLPSEFSDSSLNIWLPNPGGNARENEERIARPIEEQLRTIAGIEQIRSTSSENNVFFRVNFGADVEMNLARAEVRDRLERAWPTLPETAQPAGMWTESASSLPISFFGITVRGDPARRDYILEQVVQPRLEAISGIGKIDIWGVLQDSVRILLDEDKVTAAQLDIGTVISRLSADNFALPMGEVKDGEREIILRSDMRFSDLDEIANFPIGGGLKLKDIGRVAKVKSVSNRLTLIDGDYAYYGMATKDSQSNVVETSQNLRRTCEEIENDPATGGDVSITIYFIQGDFIESALAQLQETAIWGGLLAVVVLFVFLRRVRLTLCVALSIPVSALMSIAWGYFTGASFNLLTMTGITLGIGMLVDNSVVVVENIARIHRRGEHPLTAAVLGTRQIALAVTLATLTTVVVFLPLIFMSGNKMVRVMFGNIGIPLSVSLLASLLVAVVFLPVITARLLKNDATTTSPIGALMERVSVIPVRLVAYVVGGARALWFLFVSALHLGNRVILFFLPTLRWIIAPALVALVITQWGVFDSAFESGKALEEFGVTVGPPAVAMRNAMAVFAGLGGIVLFFAAKPWAKRPRAFPARPAQFVPSGTSLIDMIVALNQSLVGWTMQHRLMAFVLAVTAFASIAVPLSNMKVAAFGEDATDDDANFTVAFDAHFTLSEAEQEVRIYADYIEEHKEDIGFEHWTCRFDETGAEFSLNFAIERADEDVDGIEAVLEADLPRIPGHRLIFYNANQSSNTSTSVAQFVLTGPDSRELERLGAEAEKILARVPGLSQVSSPLQNSPEMIEVSVDRDLAHSMGVNTEAIQNSISWTLGGWPLPRYQEEGREVPLVIEFDESEAAGLNTLRELTVFAQTGLVPLESIAKLDFKKGAREIYRRNGQTSFTLEAKVDDPLQVIPVTERAYRALAQVDLPRGFNWDRSDSAARRTDDEFKELGQALLFSIALVFLLMGILFESILLPFSVLCTIPFAILGAMWTLFATGTPMDSFGWIGMIILAGVVVNNGIVLIDRIHALRHSDIPREQAVIDGCGQRVRPVLMTALTTVCGLLPMALTEPASQSMVDYRALATIVAGGLIASTFFTLWVVPLAYTVFDDLAVKLSEMAAWTARAATWRRASAGGGDGSGELSRGDAAPVRQ